MIEFGEVLGRVGLMEVYLLSVIDDNIYSVSPNKKSNSHFVPSNKNVIFEVKRTKGDQRRVS